MKEFVKQKEIQSTLKAIIQSTDDAISVVDENGLQTIINPAYTRLTGLTEKDVLGKPPTIDIAGGGESMLLKVLKTKKPVHGVRMRVGPTRKEVIVNVSPVVVDVWFGRGKSFFFSVLALPLQGGHMGPVTLGVSWELYLAGLGGECADAERWII